MSFTDIANKIEEQKKSLEEQKAKFLKDNQKIFKDIVKSFFAECPEIQVVAWDQYTPYFMDGEECTFSVHDQYFVLEGWHKDNATGRAWQIDDGEMEDPETGDMIEVITFKTGRPGDNLDKVLENYDSHGSKVEWYVKRASELRKQEEKYPGYYDKISSFEKLIGDNEDLMREIFGDHSTVYLMPDEIIIEECDHD